MTDRKNIFAALAGSKLVKSSFWGIAANGLQSILLSLFFVILARKYSKPEFADFLIANTIYQLLAAFSTLGLGQWFTREVVKTEDSSQLVNKFLKMQLYSGFLFYLVNILLAWMLYNDEVIIRISLVLGINIIFDNVIYAIRSLNVAEFRQEKTFVILLVDSVLKFLASCILFVYPINTVLLSVVLIAMRFLTLNVFLVFGSSNSINVKKLLSYKISFSEVKNIVGPNWAFIIIGSVSMVFWRIGNIIISKMLEAEDVANYEVSYRVFSLALILPMIISTTVFPQLVSLHNEGDRQKLGSYFHKIFSVYLLYSLLCFTFFFSFSQYIIPLVFGKGYDNNVNYTIQMFLAVLVFPTSLLQANLLVALHKEKADMWLNIVALILNVAFSFAGIALFNSLIGVNLSIFVSFLVFHMLQDYLLVKMKVTSLNKVLRFYVITGTVIGGYVFFAEYVHPVWLYIAFWGIILLLVIRFTVGFTGLKELIKNPRGNLRPPQG
ncbi:MAG: oligosaccharide flippase family protein [Ferruginibacter sp.]